jgi:carbamoyltransferase
MKPREVILGIGGFTTEASVCLVVDGDVRAAAEEERFTRIKHHGGWPKNALEWIFERNGVTPTEVTHISFSYSPWLRLSRRIPYRLVRLPLRPAITSLIILNELRSVAEFMARLRRLRKQCGAELTYIRHHLAHAASAFYSSPFDEAAFYTVDQRGEWDTTLWGRCVDRSLDVLGNTTYPDSLGIFYAGVTRHLGFGSNDEYKVMGLASYGTPRHADELRKVIRPLKDARFKLDTRYLAYHHTRGILGGAFFTPKFDETFGPPRGEGEPLGEHHMDLAASAQKVFEECVFHQLRAVHARIRSKNLCISGGCGLNGVMTGNVYRETPFEHVFLPSVSGDNGLSLGGALYVRHQLLGRARNGPLLRADLGTEYDDDEIGRMLELFKLEYRRYDDIIGPTVELLAAGKIVGWFQGRMEFGARALGNRSILANPTLATMKDDINKYVKFREEFRPFAPSVLAEAASRYFDIHDPIPFMTVVCGVNEEGIRRLPATTHVDKTARVQTVDRVHSPMYWRLIRALGDKTGVPVVLNTSFNVMGEPLVEHPRQAVRCYFSTGMDALALGRYLLTKPSVGEVPCAARQGNDIGVGEET